MKQFLDAVARNRKVQALALLLAAVVMMDAAFYFFRTAPAVAGNASMEQKIDALRARIRSAEEERAIHGSYDAGRRQLDEFKALLPRRSEYTKLLREVYKLAKEDGMAATSLSTDIKETKTGDLVELKFTMPVSGSYKSARKFISDIESSQMFLNIENLSLTTTPEGDINFTLALSTYMRS